MTLIQELNVLTDKKLIIGLNLLGGILVLPFLYLFGWLAAGLSQQAELSIRFGLGNILLLLVALLALLSVHELIHGAFFKLFHPQGKVKFGFKWQAMMAYATSPGSLYKRWPMVTIGLAPFVLISLALTLLFVLDSLSVGAYVFLAALHAAGCVGDFYYTYLLVIKHRQKNILVEDTETGLRIYTTQET